MERKMKKIGLAATAGVWLLLAFWSWIKAPDEISISERRKLADFPELTGESLFSGKFAGDFEEYSLDQFPLREEFRSLQAVSSLYLFREKDNHGIYLEKGFLAKMEPSLDPDSVKRAAEKLEKLYTAYMKGKTHRIYVSVIPNKSYYLAEPGGYPSMDYEKLFSVMKEELDFAAYLDLTEVLEAEDYYRTDTHWRQERITGAAEYLTEAMGGALSGTYIRELAKEDFRGVYYGQAALPVSGEALYILRNPVLDQCRVRSLETGETAGLYDPEALEGRDPYEVYLSGPAPVLKITNPSYEGERRLVLFGDSFSSSLAPLLAEAYSEIDLVDIRYIDPDLLGDLIEFENADVLFLYSTLLLNDSGAMR